MITPGELQKGMFVTVHHWQREAFADGSLPWGAGPDSQIITVPVCDGSYKGEVLEVMAICLPFVSVIRRDIPKGAFFGEPFRLDTRNAVLMELSKECVESLNQQKP